MGWLIVKSAGDISMKNSMWMVGLLVVAFFQASCSKSKGPSPEDTSLIKGTDRGHSLVRQKILRDNEGDELSPIGATISGLDGEDGLFPQDPFWSDSKILPMEIVHLSQSFLGLINIA